MPEVLENKRERLRARPTLLHSSAMVGHRVGFVSARHCQSAARVTKWPALCEHAECKAGRAVRWMGFNCNLEIKNCFPTGDIFNFFECLFLLAYFFA